MIDKYFNILLSELRSMAVSSNRMVFIYDTTSFDTPVWVTFWKYYMYGPCSTLEEVLSDIYHHWEDEHFIVG